MVTGTYEELEECKQTDQTHEMSKCSHNSWELLPRFEHWSKEQGKEEQSKEHGSVPNDGTNSNDTDTDQRARRGPASDIGE